ncbi:hypothetical protein [Lewinella sp. IMCC34183]|uniref:hypothetical protein n=1 Tax=Lewinella sp. IMCC34183 TaxID=2248762 RepID=UPI000E257CC8|nr:hypothetical protein [Lewinella sp. IMCC34183]
MDDAIISERRTIDLKTYKLLQIFTKRNSIQYGFTRLELTGTGNVLFTFQHEDGYTFVAFDFSRNTVQKGIGNFLLIRQLADYDYELVGSFNSAVSIENQSDLTERQRNIISQSINIEMSIVELEVTMKCEIKLFSYTIHVHSEDTPNSYSLIIE